MIASPCINVCRMDETTGYCTGCLRTLPEIAGWSAASDEEKRAVLAAVERRRAATTQGESPVTENACVGVCQMDAETDRCLGCGRSSDEIFGPDPADADREEESL
ncbi:MAG: DUF1289 domain-containing protein [Pseudomonadota bacterium]